MHRIQGILLRDLLKFQFDLSKINVSGEEVSKLIDRTMYDIKHVKNRHFSPHVGTLP